MELVYLYTKPRSTFGRFCDFRSVDAKVLETIPSTDALESDYVRWRPMITRLDTTPDMSEHEVNTERLVIKNSSMRHVEGGWPKDVDPAEQSDVQRFRKKAEKDDDYKQSVKFLGPIVDRALKQNNTINIYQDYFAHMGETATTEQPSAKGLAVFRDPEPVKRTISKIDWHPESPQKMAACYCILNFQDPKFASAHAGQLVHLGRDEPEHARDDAQARVAARVHAVQPQVDRPARRGLVQRAHQLLRCAQVRGHARRDVHHRALAPRPGVRRVLDLVQDGQPVLLRVHGRLDALVGHPPPRAADLQDPAQRQGRHVVRRLVARVQHRGRSDQVPRGHGAGLRAEHQPAQRQAEQRHHGLRHGLGRAPRPDLLDPAQPDAQQVFHDDRRLDRAALVRGPQDAHHEHGVPRLVRHGRVLVAHARGRVLHHAHGRRRGYLRLFLPPERGRVLAQGRRRHTLGHQRAGQRVVGGKLFAIGDCNGMISLMGLSDGLATLQPSEKAAINGMFEREKNLEAKEKEMRRKKATMEEGKSDADHGGSVKDDKMEELLRAVDANFLGMIKEAEDSENKNMEHKSDALGGGRQAGDEENQL